MSKIKNTFEQQLFKSADKVIEQSEVLAEKITKN